MDTTSELVVQTALDNISKTRTTISIAHRLSTIKNADKIVVIDKGIIAEEGTHESLTQQKGIYYELVKNQLELGV